MQFIIASVAEHEFLLFGNPDLIFLVFKDQGARLLPDTEVDQLPAVHMEPVADLPAF